MSKLFEQLDAQNAAKETSATPSSFSTLEKAPPPIDNDNVTVINPKGEIVDISKSQLQDAIVGGYQVASDKDIKNYDYLKENKGLIGDVKAGLYGAADEATFGILGAAHKGIDPEGAAEMDELAKEHTVANYAGRGIGFLGTMFYGGEIFGTAAKAGRAVEGLGVKALTSAAEKEIAAGFFAEGMSQAAAAKLAQPVYKAITTGALKMGTEGAIISLPKAVTEGIFGNYEDAAETLAYGFGGGAVLGGVGAGLSNVGGKAGNKLSKLAKDATLFNDGESLLTKMENQALDMTARNAGFQKTQYNKLGHEEVREATRRLSEAGYYNIGMQSDKELVSSMQRAKDDAVKMMKSGYDALDNNLELIHAMESTGQSSLIDKLIDKADSIPFKDGANKTYYNAFVSEIESLEKDLPEILNSEKPFNKFWNRMSENDKNIKWSKAAQDEATIAQREARAFVNAEKNAMIEEIAGKLGNPEISDNIIRGKQLYADAKKYEEALINKSKRDAGNRMIGLTDSLAWIGTANHALTSLFAGNIVGAAGQLLVPAAKFGIETSQAQSAIASAMYRFAKNGGPKAGLVLTAEANAVAEEQISRIPKLLKEMKTNRVLPISTARAVSEYMGKSHPTSMAERKENVKELSTRVNELMADPDVMTDRLAQMASPLTLGAPNISEAYIAQQLKSLQFIQSILPVNQTDNGGNLFKKNKYNISDAQVMKFERQMSVIHDPFVVLQDLQSNTLTRDQVDVLKNIYPGLYNKMTQKIIESAADAQAEGSDADKDMSYDHRLKLSLLLGQPLDNSIEKTAAYQQNFAAPEQNPPAKSKLELITPKSNPYATAMQKAQ